MLFKKCTLMAISSLVVLTGVDLFAGRESTSKLGEALKQYDNTPNEDTYKDYLLHCVLRPVGEGVLAGSVGYGARKLVEKIESNAEEPTLWAGPLAALGGFGITLGSTAHWTPEKCGKFMYWGLKVTSSSIAIAGINDWANPKK